MKATLVTRAAGLVLAGLAAGIASAQEAALLSRLQHASRVDCVFTQVATGNWQEGAPEITSDIVEFTASFHSIDVESGTAEAEGRFGDSYIVVRYAEGYLHFMQTLNAGPLYLTTIIAESSANGRLKAVHTRHEYTAVSLPGFTSRPEMYIGDCAVDSDQN